MVEYPRAFTSEDDANDLVEVIKFLGRLLGDEEIERILESKGELTTKEGIPRAESPKTRWFKWVWDKHKGLDEAFKRVADRAQHAGYKTSMLWTRPDALPAYRHLIESIQITGRIDDYVMGLDLDGDRNAALIAVAWMLARQAHCDCWSLYGWDRRVNLPVLLGSQNLWFPEAMVGTCWVGEVRDSLLNDEAMAGPVQITNPIGRFRAREGVVDSWKVVFRTPSLRAVLFLNWRDPDGSVSPEPASRERLPPREEGVGEVPLEQWRTAEAERVKKHPSERAVRDGSEVRDLFLAVRYLNGWLTQQRQTVVGPAPMLHRDRVTTIAEQVAFAFGPWLQSARGDRQQLSLTELPFLVSALGSIFDRQPTFKRVYGCDPTTKYLVLPDQDREVLKTRDGKRLPRREIDVSKVSQALLPPGSSLVAQSMVWKTSILLRDIDPTEHKPHSDAARHSLLDVRLHTKKVLVSDEVVVPVLSEDHTPIGGIVVGTNREDGDGIHPEHVRWLEILSFLVGGLHAVCTREDADAERQIVYDMLLADGAKIEPTDLLYRLTQWIRTTTGAALVHVLMYDDDRGVFLPRGVSAGDSLCEELREEYYLDNLPLGKLRRPLGRTLKGVLMPARRGRSWRIFYENQPIEIPNVVDVASPLPQFVYDHFGSVYGMPLSCFEGIAADGVIWICFAEPRNPVLPDDVRAKIARVSHIVASLCAAHRFNEASRNASA